MLSSKEIREWREAIDAFLLKWAEKTIDDIVSGYPKAKRVWNQLRADSFMSAQWDMSDYIAVTKMGYNAHGDIHAKVVTANALKMLDLLLEAGVQPDIVKAPQETSRAGNPVEGGDVDDAHLIILLAGLLHDIGNQVNRSDHNLHSGMLAMPILDKVLALDISGRAEEGDDSGLHFALYLHSYGRLTKLHVGSQPGQSS